MGLKSVRKGIREGRLERDTYGRLSCTECGSSLTNRSDPTSFRSVRTCPDCQSEWKEL